MKDTRLEAKLLRALDAAAPDDFASVWADCKKEKGKAKMGKTNADRKRSLLRPLAAAAACLVLLIGGALGLGAYRAGYAVAAAVSLDVNPSVRLTVNGRERVLEAVPLNDDGRAAIGDMDLAGSRIDVAVNALIGSMLRMGYLNEMANSVLISVSDEDTARGAALQARLSGQVEKMLDTGAFPGAVLSQAITEDGELREAAAKWGITAGKASLIREIIAANPSHCFEELVPLSINELNLLLPPPTAQSRMKSAGAASEAAYIGRDRAWEIACAAAGADPKTTRRDVGIDFEDGRIIYEAELNAGGREYEFEIDAVTGSVLNEDIEAGAPTSPSGGHAEGQKGEYIGGAAAKKAALAVAGVPEQDISGYSCGLECDDGREVYDIEFRAGGCEYEFHVDALTGEILEAEKEN